jgi:hypothetical protein
MDLANFGYPVGFLLSKTLKLFGFQIFRFGAYPMKNFPESRRVN